MVVRTLLIACLISLVRADDIDRLIKYVFGEPCICVPYYQCINGTITTDGTGILNRRMDYRTICKEYMNVCCNEPTESTIKPLERKGCGQRHPDGVGFRISGHNSSETQFGEFPWMIALLKVSTLEDGRDLLVYQCGGALIHEKVVLTAAHCVPKKIDYSHLKARAGEWDTQSAKEMFPYQDRTVVQTLIHPAFNGENLWNDFALLVVDKPFEFSLNVDTVCLPPPGIVLLSKECFVSGWGKDQYGQKGKYQVILKKIDLPMVPNDQCTTLLRKTRLGQYFRLHESFVCAGGILGKDTCKGDGGSPLVCPVEGKPGTYQAIGLVAWGIGCGDQTPGVYAGVSYARPWIDKTMTELGFSI
ncbi:unnamed protein product [Nezara viridula]|uniref:Phenoloxidase-activating factor 2 n=1 Tax=Nezara viridula TaxID=85310 RepID=A0A9P0HAF2_NEZVI|nr:unnamed protein product [Nezara viridula]